METFKSFESKLYTLNDESFADIALQLFRFQAVHNPIYRSFITHLAIDINRVTTLEAIPFLPIAFFKSQLLQTGEWSPEAIFTSSGTTGSATSRHDVHDLNFYLAHAQRCFESFFGPLTDYNFLALLPSYLERKGSSLIAMMDHFIRQSASPWSAFYLHDVDKMLRDLDTLRSNGRKTILWGVSFALLDLAEQFPRDLSPFLIFETGGMKGRKKEMTRAELHTRLTRAFGVDKIYSEYGMTELLSQGYTRGGNTFWCPPALKVVGRDLTDPLQKGLLHETCGINVIDLANIHSVAFIETEDLGKVYPDGSFEILGRMDNSDVRGCNLLIQ
ncbi:acyl transferase [Chryseolinea lacunae]|uniref:Acyl transferase n=1 Tax=Chryseolinea lacunae TaxID=2801331 RepID=A0ABS1KJH5_9BACT|nr:acyl transferase [Chryseolinea lacunae]MBL0739606.1 acyl transferase [Chryseolinea lacunae]